MKLYHGTVARHLPSILTEGIRPRGKGKRGNWKHTVESHPECVYMSTAYAPYFAGCAMKGKEALAVLEIDTDKLAPWLLCPDEDFLEFATRNTGPGPVGKPMVERVRWFRKRLREYSDNWKLSVQHMGNCCFYGTVPASSITRLVTYPAAVQTRMTVHGMDPVVSPLNYSVVGHRHRNYTKWLLGDPLEPDPFDPGEEKLAAMEKLDPEGAATMRRMAQHSRMEGLERKGVEVFTPTAWKLSRQSRE